MQKSRNRSAPRGLIRGLTVLLFPDIKYARIKVYLFYNIKQKLVVVDICDSLLVSLNCNIVLVLLIFLSVLLIVALFVFYC